MKQQQYYEQIAEQEERSHKLKSEMPAGPEERKDNHIARRLKLNIIKGEVEK